MWGLFAVGRVRLLSCGAVDGAGAVRRADADGGKGA